MKFFCYSAIFIYRLQKFICIDGRTSPIIPVLPAVRPRFFRPCRTWPASSAGRRRIAPAKGSTRRRTGLPQAGGRRRAQKKRGRGQRPLPRRGGDQLLRPNGSGCPSADGPSFPSWYAGRIRSRGRLRSRWAHVPRSPCRNRTGPRSSWGCWSAGGSW